MPVLSVPRQVAPRGDQCGAGTVLEAAIAVVDRVEHEHVALERRLACGRARNAICASQMRLRVGQQPLAVEQRQRAGDDELVRHAGSAEVAAPEAVRARPGDRQVRRSRRLRTCRGRWRRPSGRAARSRPASRAGIAPVRTRCVSCSRPCTRRNKLVPLKKPRCASRNAVRTEVSNAYDAVAQRQRRTSVARDAPSRLVELLNGRRCRRPDAPPGRQVARELAHHVAARDPHRQADELLRSRLVDGERDAKQMRLRFAGIDAKLDHGIGLKRPRLSPHRPPAVPQRLWPCLTHSRLGAGGNELLLDFRGGQRARHRRAVLEDQRRRAVDAVLARRTRCCDPARRCRSAPCCAAASSLRASIRATPWSHLLRTRCCATSQASRRRASERGRCRRSRP